MATNWNAILSNANSLADILMILRKVLAGLDAKADLTTIDETIDEINQVRTDVDAKIVYIDKVINESIESGLYKPFSKQVDLLAYVPSAEPVVGKAFDTYKVWIWESRAPDTIPKWHDTGLSELDQAKNFVNSNALVLRPNLDSENLNTVILTGIYRQIDNSKATTANNYPTTENGAGVLEVINNNGLIIHEYTTWYNRKFRRTKYSTFDFLPWQETPSASNIVLYYKPNLGTEDLDSILEGGVYRQLSDANATTSSHYPVTTNGAGILEVIERGNLIIQEYTTWYGLRFWRTKYSSFAFGAWQKYATQADLAGFLGVKNPLLTTENLDDVLTLGVYRQTQDTNATLERNYPTDVNGAGILTVTPHNGLTLQTFVTWYGRHFWRTKYGSFSFQKWNEYASIASINSPYKGKVVAWIGDSIVEGNNHPNRIATMLGATVHKFGFASHTMSKYPNSPLGRDKGAMYRFAKAINTGDWSDVIAGGEWVRDNLADDNMPQINAMVALDWSKVDYIMIAFGTNDIYSTTPLGENYVADANGETFIGAACYSIEQIQSKYPQIQIMFVSPTFRTRWFQTPNPDRPEQNSDTLPDPQGKPYIAYIDALLNLQDIYHIPVFDFYRKSGMNIRTWSNYLSDGVHPKENGIQLWAKKISAFMLAN